MRFFRIVICWLALCATALAQVGQTPNIAQLQPAPSGGSPTIVPGANVAVRNNAFATPITITGINGGLNFPAGSTVYVGFGNDQGSAATGVTIGGQTATAVAGATESNNRCQMFRATMPGSSQPDTFGITNGNFFGLIGVSSAYFTNITAAPTGTANETYANQGDPQFTGTLSPTATIPATGFGWAFMWAVGAGILTGNAATWQTSTPSFITASGGDTSSVLNARGQMVSAHTTATLAGATSWQAKVSGSPQVFGFIACMGAIAIGP